MPARAHRAFTKTSRLLADLAGGQADRTWHSRLKHRARSALLICDDFGDARADPAPSRRPLRTGHRTRRPQLIITSNRTPADWYPQCGNPVVAESILDWLVNTAFHIPMPGRSYRPQHRPSQPDSGGTCLPAKARR